MEMQGTQKNQTVLHKEDKVGGLTPPNFKTYYSTTIFNTVILPKI